MFRSRLFWTGSSIAAILTATIPAMAADYYFDSVGGDDTKDGSTEATAKKTLKTPSGSGHTMHVKRGSSWTMSLNLSNVTVTTYGSGARPVINGSISVNSSTVAGLASKPTTGNGFNVQSNSTVSDCEVDGNAGVSVNVGFGIMGENNKIIGNYVHDLSNSQSGGSMDNSGGAEGYMVMASNNEVAFNSAVNCQSVNTTLGGFEGGCFEIVNGKALSTISNVSFHHNYCEKSVGLWEGCSGDFSATGGNIQENHGIIENVTVAYNISVDSMWLFLLQPVNTDFRNVVFANNTIIHTPQSAVYWDSGGGHFMMALAVATYTNNASGITYDTDNQYYKKSGGFQPGTVIVRNNIFVDDISSTRNMMFMSNLADHSNNIFVPSTASLGSITLGSTEKKVNLADLAFTSDYRLTASSAPAIDAGTAISMSTSVGLAGTALNSGIFQSVFNQDIDKHAVPSGSAPDIGASEYSASAGGASTGTGTGGNPSTGGTTNANAGGTTNANTGGTTNANAGGAASTTGGVTSTSTGGRASTTGGATSVATGGALTNVGGSASTNAGGTPSSSVGGTAAVGVGGSSVVATTGGQSSTTVGGGTGVVGVGGAASTSVPPATAGANATFGGPGEEGGCSCRVASTNRDGIRGTLASLGLALLALARRRRSLKQMR